MGLRASSRAVRARARAASRSPCSPRAFAEAVGSARGEQGLLEAARALALTARELARNPMRRKAVSGA